MESGENAAVSVMPTVCLPQPHVQSPPLQVPLGKGQGGATRTVLQCIESQDTAHFAAPSGWQYCNKKKVSILAANSGQTHAYSAAQNVAFLAGGSSACKL